MEGQSSASYTLENSVFQGTAWGQPLWTCFYSDAARAVAAKEFLDIFFADDLNCTRVFDCATSNEAILQAAAACQEELHGWGRANRVSFDPSKESFHVLHRTRGEGGSFKLLGVTFDTALYMHDAAYEVATEAGWRLKSLLRTRRFHTLAEMFRLYKARILSFVESRTAGLHNAAPSVLQVIDRIQRRFLNEVHVSEKDALLKWRLAPLRCRRDIAMLGLLHRVALQF